MQPNLYHIFASWESPSFKFHCSFCNQRIVPSTIVLATTTEEGTDVRVNHWDCEKNHLDNSFIVQRDNLQLDVNIQDLETRENITNEINTAVANPCSTIPLLQEEVEESDQPHETIHDKYLKWFRTHLTDIQNATGLGSQPHTQLATLSSENQDANSSRSINIISIIRQEILNRDLHDVDPQF